MNIPLPNEYAKDHGHNPFPPRWERWLSSVRQAILTSQPTAGRNVSIDEHPGKGTVINVERKRPAAAVTGVCPSFLTATFSDIEVDCGCIAYHSGDINSIIVTEIDVNISFPDMEPDLFFGCNFFSAAETDIITVDHFADDVCSPDPFETVNDQDGLTVFWYNDFWYVWYQPFHIPHAFIFYSSTAGTIDSPPSSVSNEITECSDTPWLDDPDFATLFGADPADAFAVAHSGSVAITFTP